MNRVRKPKPKKVETDRPKTETEGEKTERKIFTPICVKIENFRIFSSNSFKKTIKIVLIHNIYSNFEQIDHFYKKFGVKKPKPKPKKVEKNRNRHF